MTTRRRILQCMAATMAAPALASAAEPAASRAEDCVFCRIDAGEVEATILWRDERCMAIADRWPFAPGHVLLMPRRHVKDLYALPSELAAHLYAFAPKLARELKRAFASDGPTCIQNNEVAGGQSVFHFHMHFVPRVAGVELWKRLNPRPEASRELREQLFAPVRAALAS
jgi:histidine triad (HIT) family protein